MLQADLQIHRPVLERIAELNKKDRLAHAYLFVGPPDIGKHETALAVAKMFHCENNAAAAAQFCETCPACLKINSGNHPDVMVLTGGLKEPIKIEKIRDLLERIRLKSFYGRKRFFILENVESMTTESANALLKILEEPDADTVLILTTANPERCLETIRSRCQEMRFFPLSSTLLEKQLKAAPQYSQEEVHFLARFSEGCLGRATKLGEEKFFGLKNDYIDAFILHEPTDDFLKHVTENKETTKEFLTTVYSWVRDGMLMKNGEEGQRIIHHDRLVELRGFCSRYSLDELRQMERSVVKTMRTLAENFNVRLSLMFVRTLLK